MKKTTALSILALLISMFGATRTVRAEGAELQFNVKVPDPKDPKQKGKAPAIEVTVIAGQKVPLDKLSLSTTNQNQKVSLKAEKIREYTEGTETVAIALVILGQEIWIGNNDYETDENAKYEGVLKNLSAAIDKLQLGNAGPPGSKGVVISYSTGAEVKVALTDLKNITGAALGAQKDYHGKLGTDLVQGLSLALAELSKVTTARKALIVVGDGSDTNAEAAKGTLAELKKQAAKAGIQTFGIIYKSAVSSETIVIPTMIPTVKTVNSIDGIQSELAAIIARMSDRYYVTFPGYDEKLGQGFPWDGKEHDMVLKVDQTESEPVSLGLAPVWNPPKKGGFPIWLAIVIPIGAIMLIGIGIKVFGSKPAPQPQMPMPVAAPMPDAGPPKPAGPMKTVMFNAGGGDDGFPIVAWLVALNGSSAYQTFRLRSGVTKIGTKPPADMVVNDGFMSTEHCQIAAAPGGFTLIDNGSTNGTYVNDRKVQKQELIDNDVITLGKTNFKFKTIN